MDPDAGDILIDGQSLKDLRIKSFRKEISYCPQNPIMFNSSVIDNLRYSDLDKYFKKTSEEDDFEYVPKNGETVEQEIEDYCKEFNLSTRISNTAEGYFTSLGDQGAKFSGGERQRFNIIRCLLKDSKVVLFDEPINALDAINEKVFIDQVKNLQSQGKTVIIVSHKLSLCHQLDNIKILYIGKNNYIESGKHEELINKKGDYNVLYEKYLETISNSSD